MKNLFVGANGRIRPTTEGFNKFKKWGVPHLCQLKLDGIWASVIKDEGDIARVYSRTSQEKGNADLQSLLDDLNAWLPEKTILLGELGWASKYETDLAKKRGFHRIVLFDVLLWKGEKFMHYNTQERYEKLKDIMATCPSEKIELVPTIVLNGSAEENKQRTMKWYDEVVKAGMEGLMLKECSMMYQLGGMRTYEMTKIKKLLTKDYVICRFEGTDAVTYKAKGLTVSAMWLGLYIDGKLTEISKLSAFDLEWREKFSKNPDEYIGQTVEVGCYEVFPSGAARSPWFIRLRPDKLPTDCTMEEMPDKLTEEE